VRIIYTMREKNKNVCKHVVESYTIYLKILKQRDWIRLKRWKHIMWACETVSHFLLDCPRHTTLRQQLFFSLLDIPETISLNILIFGSVNLSDEESKAVFKSVQTFIIKSKRFTKQMLFFKSVSYEEHTNITNKYICMPI
jgi:hypothetical protein